MGRLCSDARRVGKREVVSHTGRVGTAGRLGRPWRASRGHRRFDRPRILGRAGSACGVCEWGERRARVVWHRQDLLTLRLIPPHSGLGQSHGGSLNACGRPVRHGAPEPSLERWCDDDAQRPFRVALLRSDLCRACMDHDDFGHGGGSSWKEVACDIGSIDGWPGHGARRPHRVGSARIPPLHHGRDRAVAVFFVRHVRHPRRRGLASFASLRAKAHARKALRAIHGRVRGIWRLGRGTALHLASLARVL